jgi:hypothetical protein
VRARLLVAASLVALAACQGSESSGTTTGAETCTLIGSAGGGGAGGGEDICLLGSSNCTDCVQTVCVDEASACSDDAICATASCLIENCVCQHQAPRPVCEERFLSAGPAAATAGACLAASCASYCGWVSVSSQGSAP